MEILLSTDGQVVHLTGVCSGIHLLKEADGMWELTIRDGSRHWVLIFSTDEWAYPGQIRVKALECIEKEDGGRCQ